MKTITIHVDGQVCRWAGGAFIAIWRADRAEQPVPDAMIELPASLTRQHATRDDIIRVVAAHNTDSEDTMTGTRSSARTSGDSFDPQPSDDADFRRLRIALGTLRYSGAMETPSRLRTIGDAADWLIAFSDLLAGECDTVERKVAIGEQLRRQVDTAGALLRDMLAPPAR